MSTANWTASDGCSIQWNSSRGIFADAICEAPGPKMFNVSVYAHGAGPSSGQEVLVATDSFPVHVSRTNLCFEWYVAEATPHMTIPFHHGDPTIELHVWIYDIENSADDERARTALAPSPQSQRLTREFHNLGERPALAYPHDYYGIGTGNASQQMDQVSRPLCFDIVLTFLNNHRREHTRRFA